MTGEWIRTAARIAVLFLAMRLAITKPLPPTLAGAGLLISLIAVLVVGLLEDDYERKWLTVVLVAAVLEAGRLGVIYAEPVIAKLK